MSVRITNFGLDACASTTAGTSSLYFGPWHQYSAVGTGSANPAQSDTALAAEVMRTSSSGGFPTSGSATRDGATNKLRYTVTSYRVFNFTASYNLTEFGHFTGSSGANCVYRDLFRQDPNNPNSLPVVISVQSGDQLQLIRALTVTCDWLTTSKSFVITGTSGNDSNGTHAGDATAFCNSDASVLGVLVALWPGGSEGGAQYAYLHCLMGANSNGRDTSVSSSGGAAAALTADTYTNGSYERTKRVTFSTSQANVTMTGWAVTSDVSVPSVAINTGYKFVLTNPASFTKDSLHTLTLVFRMTWARG